jgi:hypothetical protein
LAEKEIYWIKNHVKIKRPKNIDRHSPRLIRYPNAVFRIRIRIRIHRIHVFFGLPDPDPLVRGIDPDPALDPALDPDPALAPDPDPSIIVQKYFFYSF